MMKLTIFLTILATSLCASRAFAPSSTTRKSPTIMYGIIDDLKLIFSDEGKQNRANYDRRQREEQEAAQREILERRRNPEKMKDYEQQVMQKRQQLSEDRSVWDFQNKVGGEGYDPLSEWNRLREEGKITVGSELERDESSSRLGSEGLVDVRVDERMPYIDQGYVDDNADAMGSFMDIFGNKKNKDKGSD